MRVLRFLFTGLVANFELSGFDFRKQQQQKNAQLMTFSIETLRMVKSRPRKNQSERSELPQDHLAI